MVGGLFNKKAQVWSLDVIVASMIFIIGILLLFFYAINYNSQTKINLDQLFYEGNFATDLLLTDGNFGIVTNGKIDPTKISSRYGDQSLCDFMRTEMGLSYNYYFVLGGNSYCDIPTNPDDKIKVNRVVIFENKPTKLEFFVYG